MIMIMNVYLAIQINIQHRLKNYIQIIYNVNIKVGGDVYMDGKSRNKCNIVCISIQSRTHIYKTYE